MQMKIRQKILGEPVPKARPRVKDGKAHTPKKTKRYEKHVKLVMRAAKQRWEVEHRLKWPMLADVAVVLTIRTMSRARGDIDNLAKAVLDGMNGILYKDDSQVTCLMASMAVDPDMPEVDVTVSVVKGEELVAQERKAMAQRRKVLRTLGVLPKARRVR